MTEEFLYHIWQFKRFSTSLKTLEGYSVEVIHPGQQNVDAGPDFLHARVKIKGILWIGNVEIHTKTSDWHFHGHAGDKNYENLILHVVYIHDIDILPHDCPLLELKDAIPNGLVDNYKNLIKDKQFIPCENLFATVDEFTKTTFVESLFIQRLQNKAGLLNQRLKILNGHWEALLFERIAYVFGLHVNSAPFELLAKSFSFKNLQSIQRKNENLEAFLFGQAGFLTHPKDEYHQMLADEYQFLQHKYNVLPLDNHLFKMLRLRPSNFPTVRIAQLANLYQQSHSLFDRIINATSLAQLNIAFHEVVASDYWINHYTFGKISKRKIPKILSKKRIDLLILNAIIPVRFLYEKTQGSGEVDHLIEVVRGMSPEQNSIINNYKSLGAEVKNAVDSQAYLELKKNFCEPKKCLHCRIGNKIINNAG